MERSFAIFLLASIFGLMVCVSATSFSYGFYNESVITYIFSVIILVFGVNIIEYEMRLK